MRRTRPRMFMRDDERLPNVPTPDDVTRVLGRLVSRYGVTYFDAVRELCDFHAREYDSILPLLTPDILGEMELECSRARRLKDNTRHLEVLG